MATKERLRLAVLKKIPSLCSRPLQPSTGTQQPKVLVIRPDHLGDVLLSVPALRLLRAALPQADITALVGPWSKEVLARGNHVDSIETCLFPGFTRRPKGFPWAPYQLLRREAQRLQSKGFDVALNLRPDFWWGAMLAYLAGIPQRLGYDVPECLPFLSQALPHKPSLHHVEQSLDLVRALVGQGMSCSTDLSFPVTLEEEAFAREQVRRWPGSGPLVFLHPGSGAPVKLWTAAGFAQVADALVERYKARVVVVGGPGEEALVRAVAHAASHSPYVLMGATLGQMAALQRLATLAVGLDSGIMHLAVAVGTPSVHLYGPVDKATFGPWGPGERHLVVTSDLPCIPCNRLDYRPRELARHTCVRGISPSNVLQAVERLIETPIQERPGTQREALV
ncbi:MAG: glycosyltransferase family 9 protein [Dehalococcoidia bacterium]|nr:glycosyltransferase family 9 protein [Dehalococcoidia bacterium]